MEESTAPSRTTELNAVFDAVAARLDDLVDRIVRAFQAEIPYYAAIPADALKPGIAGDARRGLAALRERRALTTDEADESARVGEERARQGVPADAMMLAFRLAVREFWSAVREAASHHDVDGAAMLGLYEDVWRVVDAMIATSWDAHRAAELESARHDEFQRGAFLRRLLFGGLGAAELAGQGSAYGLTPGSSYVPFRARAYETAAAVELDRAIRVRVAGPGLVGFLDDDMVGILTEPPVVHGIDAVVGVGPPAELGAIEPSFEIASRAVETGYALGLRGVHGLDALALEAIVSSETYLTRRLVERYVAPLASLGPFGATLETTLREYFASGMSIERTSQALFVHPNTLRLRLRRYHELTGADLRTTRHIVEVWLALARAELDARRPLA